MKKLIMSAAVAGLLFAGALTASAQTSAPAPAPDTTTVPTPVELDGLSLTLPAGFSKFEKQEQTVQSDSGPILNVTNISKSVTGEVIIVSYSDFSGPLLNPNQMMTSGKDSLLKGAGAQSESEEFAELDGNPGMKLLFSAQQPRPLFGRGQYAVDDDRMYQMIFLTNSAERRASPVAETFFSSIDLTEQSPEAPVETTEPAAAAAPSSNR